MDQLETTPPPADWLTITGGAANYAGGVEIRRSGSEESQLYAPVWPVNTIRPTAKVVLKVHDPGAIEIAKAYFDLQGDAKTRYGSEHIDRLVMAAPISGLRIREFSADGIAAVDLSKGSWQLAPDFIVIDQDARPSARFAVLQLCIAIGLSAYAYYLVRAIRRIRRAGSEPELRRL